MYEYTHIHDTYIFAYDASVKLVGIIMNDPVGDMQR